MLETRGAYAHTLCARDVLRFVWCSSVYACALWLCAVRTLGCVRLRAAAHVRYWVLKLLIYHFAEGDSFVYTSDPSIVPASNPFCAWVDGHGGYVNASLACASGVISAVDFAAFGTPTGHCGGYAVDPACNSDGVLAFAQAACVGRASCEIPSYPNSYTPEDPCLNVYKFLKVCGDALPHRVRSTHDATGRDPHLGSIICHHSSEHFCVVEGVRTSVGG